MVNTVELLLKTQFKKNNHDMQYYSSSLVGMERLFWPLLIGGYDVKFK